MSRNPYFVSKKAGEAIADYRMLRDKDRILVAVSGGKDSLALLKILRDRLRFVPIDYKLIAVHINFDSNNAIIGTLVKVNIKKGFQNSLQGEAL